MKKLFNQSINPLKPYLTDLSLLKSEEWNLETFAATLDMPTNSTSIMAFKDVDDHIDGNGLAILWMVKGSGTFYHEDGGIELKIGDVVVFDDKKEHGFAAQEVCWAVNIAIPKFNSDLEVKQELDKFVASTKTKSKHLAVKSSH